MPSCISDLSAAATELKRDHPREFGDLGALSQAFGLFVFSYSCGSLAGPTIVGVIKAKADWGAATSVLASACALACVPIVSFTHTLFLNHSAPKRGHRERNRLTQGVYRYSRCLRARVGNLQAYYNCLTKTGERAYAEFWEVSLHLFHSFVPWLFGGLVALSQRTLSIIGNIFNVKRKAIKSLFC